MGKTPVVLAAGLVVGAAAIVWLQNSPEPADEPSVPALAADTVLESQHAALASRVADLEEQMSALTFAIDALAERLAQEAERADSLDAESAASAAAMRDIQQLLSNRADGGAQGPNPGGEVVRLSGAFEGYSYVSNANGEEVIVLGPDGEQITADTIAAAAASGNPMTAPPTLTGVQASTGQNLVLRVTGTNEGPVWGTDVYTDDSSLGAAAVHAGILRPGETGTIMVTVQDGYPAYAPSSRNGIESESWDEWGRSFTMLRIN
jgi:hypothetical protein